MYRRAVLAAVVNEGTEPAERESSDEEGTAGDAERDGDSAAPDESVNGDRDEKTATDNRDDSASGDQDNVPVDVLTDLQAQIEESDAASTTGASRSLLA